ncbi:MAG: deoxyguanosinetriphosphate triphosphohydrolase [Chloroflexi bacterium]|nr:deoxyguanosinetriphosphate triphosphohydrolase [Chloroflexota bacterium]
MAVKPSAHSDLLVGQAIRLRLEAKEDALSPYAALSARSRGRLSAEPPDPMRTEFQRDRDRIIHAKAFRRLKHKTQVFILPEKDHYVTRLTHTLEVAQIARSIARALNLNEDLTEAIALGHDLGHPPFGHIGEEVLAELYPAGFRHGEQSLRVVDCLEKDGQGLNLTYEVRQGILQHSKALANLLEWPAPETMEAQVVKVSDTIAYINHDLGDAIRAGLVKESDLPAAARSLGASSGERINSLVWDVVEHSWVATGDPLQAGGKPEIAMSPEVIAAANGLQAFLLDRVYARSAATEEAHRAREALRRLYAYYTSDGGQLPQEYVVRAEDAVERRVVDYIAGMTDNFALGLAGSIGG